MRAPFSTYSPRGRRARWAGLLSVGLMATGAAGAQAASDPGHSGNQTSEPPATPLGLKWSQAGDVVTPPLITGGTANTRRVVYGTADGTVYVRNLATGALVGSPIDLDEGTDDADSFTGLEDGTVGFVDASDDGAPGNVFIVRNEDVATGNDVSLAWIDTASGTAHDVGLAEGGSLLGGYTISSAPVLTPPDGSGNRVLYFIASGGTSQQLKHLYRLPIGAANSASPVIDTSQLTRSPRTPNPDPTLPDIVPDINANPWSSPSIVYDVGGIEWVAVGTTDGYLQAYRTDDNTFAGGQHLEVDLLDDDPDNSAPETPAWDLSTPVVPTGPAGEIPGRNGYPAAPYFYVAHNRGLFAARPPEAPTNTSITKIAIGAGAAPFSVDSTSASAVASGYPGPSMALTQTVGADGNPSTGGRLVVTAENGIRVVNADTLAPIGSGIGGSAIANSPATGGGYGFASKDDGTQVVVDLASGNPVAGSAFTDVGPAGTTAGAPALAGGFAVFAGSGGIAAYSQTTGGGGTTPPPSGGGGGTTPPPSGGGGGTTPPPSGGGVAPDTTDPRVTLSLASSQRGVSRRKVTLKVRCNETCALRVTGAFTGVRTTSLRKSLNGRANRTLTVTLSLTRAQRNAIRRALRRGKRVTLRLTIRATDAAGNVTTTRKTIRITG